MFVDAAISHQSINKVFAARPPEINPNEATLPRLTRSALAQLRSGDSRRLNSYLHRLNPAIPNVCSVCNMGPHDTAHLFNCPEKPIPFQPIDLWLRPIEVAQALQLDPRH